MARIGLRSLVVALALALAAIGPARAQQLQRLTVDSFTFSADTAHPVLETPFHLIVSLHVRESVTSIDNVNLPILAELELQGDERSTVSAGHGTQYTETITVVAHHTGTISIAPVTLQAVDARDGKSKQYFSNPLTLVVGGGPLEPLAPQNGIAAALRATATAMLWLFGIACAIAIVLLFARRRRPLAPVPEILEPALPPPAPVVRSRRDVLEDALAVLRAERTRGAAVRVRGAVWRMVGATDGETLGDVLTRPEAEEPRMRELLRALERAAFTYDADVQAAIESACTVLERYLA